MTRTMQQFSDALRLTTIFSLLSTKQKPTYLNLSPTNTYSSIKTHPTRSFTANCLQSESVGELQRYHNLPNDQKAVMDSYIHYLLQENKKYNLTGLNTFEECVEQVVDDTCALLPLINRHVLNQTFPTLVDIGSGAGIPGIILSILQPNWKVVCIEATEKKVKFMKEVIQRCGVKNVDVVRSRCEELAHQAAHRESYDLAISRGVAELRTLVEYGLPFLKLDGLFIAPKGPTVQNEVEGMNSKALESLLGGELVEVTTVESFGDLGQRTAVIVRKVKPTHSKYPRKPGIPTKRPL